VSYGLDGPGFKSRQGQEIFLQNCNKSVKHDHIYFFYLSMTARFPCGPYGLYRASVSVQGCTLSFLPMTACFGLQRPSWGHLYKTFLNKAHNSAIIIHTMGSHMCCSSYYKVKLYRTLSKIWNVIAGGCEVQVFKLCIDNIKNSKHKYRLLTL